MNTITTIPILHIDEFLLITIQVDLHDRLALRLQDDIATHVVAMHAKGVLIDITALDMVDSFIGRMLGNMSALCAALGANTVVVGMQPAVAITVVELGLLLTNVHTARNVDQGMALLRRLGQLSNQGSRYANDPK